MSYSDGYKRRFDDVEVAPDYNGEVIISEILGLTALTTMGRKFGFGIVANPLGLETIRNSKVPHATEVLWRIFAVSSDFEFTPTAGNFEFTRPATKSWTFRLGKFKFSMSRSA